MSTRLFTTLRIGKWATSALLMCTLIILSFGPVLPVHKIHAQVAVTAPILEGIQTKSTIETTIISGATVGSFLSDAALKIKAYILDGLVWDLTNAILQQMSKQIVTWINSGFKGSPAFVTDMNKFLIDVTDKVAGDYIWGSSLNFLCSPFKLDIRAVLDIQYRQSRDGDLKCSLSGVASNLTNFINGKGFSGGWDTWFQITQNPKNNPYGELTLAQAEMSARIVNSRGQEIKLLEFGKGMFTKKKMVCTGRDDRAKCEEKIITPGDTINAQLNNALNLPTDRLKLASEINQILGALFTQLASQALSGAGGLLGLTNSGYGSDSGSYYDKIARDESKNDNRTTSGNPIGKSIEYEKKYIAVKKSIATLIGNVRNYKNQTYGTSSPCHSGELAPELQDELISIRRDTILASTTIAKLNELSARVNNASATPQTKGDAMNEYLDLQSNELLHTQFDVIRLNQTDIPYIEERISVYKGEVDSACIARESTGG